MPLALLIAGGVVHLVGYVWLILLAYQEAPKAGRVAIFIWPLGLLFPLLRWDATVMKAFALAVIGLAMAWGGDRLMPEPPPQPDPLKGFSIPK